MSSTPIRQRFDTKWTPVTESGCWIWCAGLIGGGYGQFKKGRQRLAHRIAWELYRGPVPEGLCVLHRCDVRCCVNPAHLFLGSKQENMADRDRKGRQARGQKTGTAKLTETEIRAIRADVRSQRVIALGYGVSKTLIRYIKHRKH